MRAFSYRLLLPVTLQKWRSRQSNGRRWKSYAARCTHTSLLCVLWRRSYWRWNFHAAGIPIFTGTQVSVHHHHHHHHPRIFIATQVLKQNFRAAMCHVLHYSCNVNAAVADSLHCRMICGTVPSSVHAWMPPPLSEYEMVVDQFCSCDLDLDPMTFINETDLYSLDIHTMCEYELPTSRLSTVWQTDR